MPSKTSRQHRAWLSKEAWWAGHPALSVLLRVDLQGEHHPPAEILNTAHLCPLGNREAHTLPRSANTPTSVPLSGHSLRPLWCWPRAYPVGYWILCWQTEFPVCRLQGQPGTTSGSLSRGWAGGGRLSALPGGMWWTCLLLWWTCGLISSLSVQSSSVAQSCLTLCDPMNRSTPGLPVHHQLLEFTQTHVHRVSDAIQPSHRPLLLPPSIFPSIRVFSNESAFSIRWPKDWSFSFSISPSNEHLGLISFRMDWLDLLAVQGTLKSLLQHHSSKASILRRSAFVIVQLSHPYMSTGKTIALTRWTWAQICRDVGLSWWMFYELLKRNPGVENITV